MNDWDLSNIRADIMLATDIEHLQAIDNYYENIINKLQSKIDKAIEYCEYNDESLYTFEPDYDYEENMTDNYEPSSFRENIMEILKDDK